MGSASGTRRAVGRLAGLTTLALLATSIGLPAAVAAAPPVDPPRLADDARAAGHGLPGIRDLGLGPADAAEATGRDYVPGVVLVGYRAGTSASDRGAARRAARARSHRSVSKLAPDLERFELEPGTSVPDAVRALKGRHGVRFAEPDYIVTVDHEPNDWVYTGGDMWGMEGLNSVPASAYGFGTAAAEAWQANEVGSHKVYVGIVDTGIDISHRDLAPNIWTNPFETPGNGVDDDGNGYIDDVHGWDFFHDDASVFDSTAADYHGTHVAGTIGAAGANDEGVVGVNWAVTMIPAKFIDGEGSESGAIAALDYLTDLKINHGLNIVATNNSWGGAELSTPLEDAINRGGDAGILFVAAAGNSHLDLDATPDYPASSECDTRFDTGMPRGYDCLISVAALTEQGALASFSNYGATSVDIGAPGAHIASTYPGNNYAYLDGTSMATPHVTGALALLASCQASPTAQGLENSLYNRGVATASLAGITSTGKRVQVGAMMSDCTSGTPPRVYITGIAGGTEVPAEFWLYFSEGVTGLEVGDFTLGGSSTGWSVDSVGGTAGTASYEVTVLATSPPAGTLSLTLAAGSVDGLTLSGPATPETFTTLVDRAAPTATAPTTSIRSGAALSGGAIPARVSWTAADTGSGLHYSVLWYSINGSAWNMLDAFVTSSVDVLLNPTGTLRFEIQAFDWAGHGSSYAIGPVISPRLSQEGSSAITYGGSWALSNYSSYSAGAVRYTSVGKRTATYSLSGRSFGFVTTIAASRGVVKIKVDGVQVARIDLGRSTTTFRYVAWSKTYSTVKTHKIQVVVVGGYGRVDVDAFAVLR